MSILWHEYIVKTKINIMKTLESLSQKSVWKNFIALNQIPRPSKKEEKVIDFIKKFGENLALETLVDKTGNVLIKKAASEGMEDRETVILQAHLDMVHQKEEGVDINFEQDPIQMYLDDDGWVKAKGTTLGADNGIGVAYIMSILASNEYSHPAIEALFTVDEETGLTGAKGLEPDFLSGSILINLDTEEDDEITIGCAGGMDISITDTYATAIKDSKEHTLLEVSVSGLTGGHSGVDAHHNRGNANKILNEILLELTLWDLDDRFFLHTFKGGNVRNAIPRKAIAKIAIKNDDVEMVKSMIDSVARQKAEKYQHTDPNLSISYEEVDTDSYSIDVVARQVMQNRFFTSIGRCLNGVYSLSPEVEGLVQTSNNVAIVEIAGGVFAVSCLVRSSNRAELLECTNTIREAFIQIERFRTSNGYPGWQPNPDSPINQLVKNEYIKLFGEEPKVNAIHAGLECGIIGKHYPNMHMTSFGPTIRGAHSPDEKVNVASVEKVMNLLLQVLKNIPRK